ncbi:MFS transporter [Amycolatopsis antarctica]|uniref:MFS transporter n=1 Tax=Amycolatopsis antarctica TaxID=1854586 RepID=A0A263D5B7_9PSEU|nr:peptide MFS transporter [Amycolatopsis antarctica]OZM73389.1 MFS transporter [Amycolatopsis antarctica]
MGTSAGTQDKQFLGQPRGLANLFGVEMWERFSFYGMQGILTIYLYYSSTEGGLGLEQATAAGIVGAYGGLVYLSTIIGAWVADRLLGAERTLFYSAVLIMAGHISLAVLPGFLGVGVGLVAVAVGSGGLKANATTLVGGLYAKDDERRDAGFTIFYVGVNIGSFLGPLLTGLAQKELGFHFGFGLAAIGMAAGLVQYAIGRRNLGEEAGRVPNPLPAAKRVPLAVAALAVVALILVVVLTGLVTADNLANVVTGVIIAATIVYFGVILSSKQVTAVERKRVYSFIPMFVASAAFFSLYQQQFTAVTIYTDERLDRNIFGWEMPVSWINAINPVFIILLAGVFVTLWTKLGPRQPSTPIKFAMANVIMGVAFLMFLPASGGSGNTTPLILMIAILLVFTIAELLLSPVGLSLSTKLAPEAFRSQMVALNYLSVALGTSMSGVLAEFYSPEDEFAYFGVLGVASIVIGVLLAGGSKFIGRLMGGIR